MRENQKIEWKQNWHDDYLKWVCGFANANGGKLVIGKNDKGEITGIDKAHKLMEDLPNKIRDILGLTVDINLVEDKKKAFLEINIEPYPSPISYKGHYYYRSGSTLQELKGPSLERFLLGKIGKKWDSVPAYNFSIDDLDPAAFQLFRKKSVKSERIPEEDLNVNDAELLNLLNLTEKNYLKRAAIILFGQKPENLITGAYVKIGYFRTDADLLFQDEIYGNLFLQAEKTLELLLTKYLKANIDYERLSRIETYDYPKKALREALLNALIHKDYSDANPIQISVYKDKLLIWNSGHLPDTWTVETLKQKHPSLPANPDIANTFFRAGYIEIWGRGTLNVVNYCVDAGLPE
ncbi:putative DNA binding domain-containing protein, partial [bacterium]|nr:putative DNA binding domain-containing protein [bacterium]